MPTDRERVRKAIVELQDVSCLLPIVRRALAAVEDSNCTNARLEEILVADQGLSARILRLANSAYFGVSGDVYTLSMAVTIVGYRRLEMMLRHVLASEVLELLSPHGEAAAPIWEIGVASAALSHETSLLSWVGDPDELLTVGLLHNIGELALLSLFRDEFLSGRAMAAGKLESDRAYTVLGVDLDEAGRWLLDSWSFPSLFGVACEFWRRPLEPAVDPRLRQRLCVIHAAARLARAFHSGCDEQDAFREILPGVTEQLRLAEPRVRAVYGKLPRTIASVRKLLQT